MIGIIGGSGIYEALALEDAREESIETPFGEPSAPVTVGSLPGAEREVAFLPRHGRDHQYAPTDVPYRANIYALKSLGVTHLFATNAVGSLREDLPPRTLVVPDQLFDRTSNREPTFFGDGLVVHQSFAEPFCRSLSEYLLAQAAAAREAGALEVAVVDGGTYVCIEGPQFSTRAESEFYRAQGWDVIGMTAVPEAKLAREAEIAYVAVTGVTDYDVWREDSSVTLEEVLENAAANEAAFETLLSRAIRSLPADHTCDCHSALAGTINTPAEAVPDETRERVDLLVEDYL
jgi:5'-methylthioadenosine phosphorylase